MSSANQIVEKRRDDMAARPRIRSNRGASPIRREVGCKTYACPDNRIYGYLIGYCG